MRARRRPVPALPRARAGHGPGWLLAAALTIAAAPGQRALQRGRPEPSATAARAGSAVDWRPGVAVALEESQSSGKPVLWYLPTVQGSPMDRKAEIDRYLMAGPWSHPDVIALANAGFVPVRAVASGKLARQHGLQRGEFVEPGLLVLAPSGTVALRLDRLTTLHPGWLLARLTPHAAAKPVERPLPDGLRAAWAAYAAFDLAEAAGALAALDEDALAPELRAEAGFLRGACLARTLRLDQARGVWQAVAASLPEQPWAWKCAAEAEGHGPFARGFEDFSTLPAAVLHGAAEGSAAAAGAYSEAELRVASTRYLIAMQEPDGGYRDSRYDFGGEDSMPNVHAAVTALVGLALLEEAEPGPDRGDAHQAALRRALAFVLAEANVNPEDSDEIVWAHAYRVLWLARWLELRPADRDRLRPALTRITRALETLQPSDGAWFHEYQNPFATATALLALGAAERAGVAVDRDRIARGVKALQRSRARSGAFTYSQVRAGEARADVRAAACRMPLCEAALARWQESPDQAALAAALRAFFAHHELLASVRKYDDHANAQGHGGFFYWYDLAGTALAILAVRDAPARAAFAADLHAIVLALPELDGCFVDSHELGKVYGTASALWCLALLRRA